MKLKYNHVADSCVGYQETLTIRNFITVVQGARPCNQKNHVYILHFKSSSLQSTLRSPRSGVHKFQLQDRPGD